MTSHTELDDQPINSVRWLRPEDLRSNTYNPNLVAPPELRLLKISILEDGWTTPIVITPSHEVIDGFHRWHLALTDRDIRSLTDGLVPVVTLDVSVEHQRMSTIRHNRARGTHHVVKMADIVQWLLEVGVDETAIRSRLQMDREEVSRLASRGKMTERGAKTEFSKGWTVE